MNLENFLKQHKEEIFNFYYKENYKNADFYKYKNGELFPIPKKILNKYIDEFKPNTFLWVLEELDIPFIEYKWTDLIEKYLNKVPSPKLKNFYNCEKSPILGRYISTYTYLKEFRGFGFKDSFELNFYYKDYTEKFL